MKPTAWAKNMNPVKLYNVTVSFNGLYTKTTQAYGYDQRQAVNNAIASYQRHFAGEMTAIQIEEVPDGASD